VYLFIALGYLGIKRRKLGFIHQSSWKTSKKKWILPSTRHRGT